MELEQVKFHKKWIKPIREGRKTQTIRTPEKRIESKEGDIVVAVFPESISIIALGLTKTGYKSFKNIDDDDAKREGFTNSDELKQELLDIYPYLEDYNRVYYYQFMTVAEINADHMGVELK